MPTFHWKSSSAGRLEPLPAPVRSSRAGGRFRLYSIAPFSALIGLMPILQSDCGGDPGDDTVTAAELLAVTDSCAPLAGVSRFATDSGGSSTVQLCGLEGAIFFKADMDIDCDGGTESACEADPYYQPETSCVDSGGDPLDASNLPFVVLPLDSNGFDDANYGIRCGSVVAVVYGDQVEYGVVGDRGPKGVIGEASYAMAELFGINPSPVSGGVDSGVTYIVFSDNAVVSPIESHTAAETLGTQEALELIANNP